MSSYTSFKEFIERYQTEGFKTINAHDPLMVKLEEELARNHQFFYVADLISLKLFYVSQGSLSLIGVKPEDFDLSTFLQHIHPDERERYSLARAKYFKIGQDLLLKKDKFTLMSSCFRVMKTGGTYKHLLFQGYSYYAKSFTENVFTILVLTDLRKINLKKLNLHYYVGNDETMFRYPDLELLQVGAVFSARELEILNMIGFGMDSQDIAERLFISENTVNTHRRNILKKSNKSNTHEIVIELKEKGLL